MGEISDLELARAERSGDNREVRPDALLRMVQREIDDLRRKGFDVDRMVVVIDAVGPDRTHDVSTLRCGLDRFEEIALLEIAKVHRIEDARE